MNKIQKITSAILAITLLAVFLALGFLVAPVVCTEDEALHNYLSDTKICKLVKS